MPGVQCVDSHVAINIGCESTRRFGKNEHEGLQLLQPDANSGELGLFAQEPPDKWRVASELQRPEFESRNSRKTKSGKRESIARAMGATGK